MVRPSAPMPRSAASRARSRVSSSAETGWGRRGSPKRWRSTEAAGPSMPCSAPCPRGVGGKVTVWVTNPPKDSYTPSGLCQEVPVVAAVEEQRLAVVRFGGEHVAGQDQVVAAVDQVPQLAGDPHQAAGEAGQLLALRPLDVVPFLGLGVLGRKAPRQPLL